MKSNDFSRSDRLSDQIRTEISFILKSQVKDPRLQGLTITKVQISRDLKKAYVLIYPINSFNDSDENQIQEGLDKAKGFIRSSLGKRIKIKRLPELIFEQDLNPII